VDRQRSHDTVIIAGGRAAVRIYSKSDALNAGRRLYYTKCVSRDSVLTAAETGRRLINDVARQRAGRRHATDRRDDG